MGFKPLGVGDYLQAGDAMIPHFEDLAKERGLLISLSRSSSRPEAQFPGPLRRQIETSMQQELYRMISEKAIVREVMDYSVEFRLKLVIATPDQFYRLVQDEAMRYDSFRSMLVVKG